ncbi:unknown [Clostridium sp. CAG:288]|nr:unknown [Clostridium sp. CAG:288]
MKTNNYSLFRKTISDKRDSLVFNLSDSELKSLFSGKTIKEKMINFFTLKGSKRLELIKKGYIVFGLVFSSSYINNSNLIRTRIIFSPSYELADNKEEMLAIADKINEWVDSVNFKKLTMKEKKLYQAIISDEEEPNYIQIPESIIGNKLVYLSLIFVNKDDFLNGMVPIIINRKISKEILLVPQAMYSNEYIESLEEDN